MSAYPGSPPEYEKLSFNNSAQPESQQFGPPGGQQFGQPGGQQFGQPGGQQYGQPGGQQFGQPGGQQFGQPGGQQYGQPYAQQSYVQTPFHSNTTVVTTQPNVLVIQPSPPPPNNHMALAIVSCLLCFAPLGVVAVICSSQSSDSARAGNYEDAATKGKISLGFSIAAIALGSLTVIIVLAIYFSLGFGYYGK